MELIKEVTEGKCKKQIFLNKEFNQYLICFIEPEEPDYRMGKYYTHTLEDAEARIKTSWKNWG